ncbi:mechanosensitive ion channel family protein [Prolixibacteraceae bacterium Z1-6]|uniref:Mechanosensitive ion channel family protein n=1 Tax=Draconibacterium aestuarii TaxID=2998507 RepID=A0A9X3FFC9_9BACT|nr:mechanosensitive ion channel family protein [Prolixibacteraceae bacterium Z1-6]
MEFNLSEILPPDAGEKAIKVILIVAIGMLLVQLLAYIAGRIISKGKSRHLKMIIRRVIVYTGVVLIVLLVFNTLGVKAGALFGAAGVVGIVLGIASQTSIGNIISGIFLVSERSFEIGDLVRVGDKLGVVDSIDLLSIKLKTLDNLLIRIPNQTIITTELTNITRYPIRRMEVLVSVAYKEDLRKVTQVLNEVLANNTLCLDEPEPLVIFKEFADSGINIQLGLWFEKSKYKDLRNSIFIDLKEAFDKNNIEIPFPHISLYSGEDSKPIKMEFGKQLKTEILRR